MTQKREAKASARQRTVSGVTSGSAAGGLGGTGLEIGLKTAVVGAGARGGLGGRGGATVEFGAQAAASPRASPERRSKCKVLMVFP